MNYPLQIYNAKIPTLFDQSTLYLMQNIIVYWIIMQSITKYALISVIVSIISQIELPHFTGYIVATNAEVLITSGM